jgi:hypothetical protein
MRLQITYNEFEQFLCKNFQQKTVSQIRLAYVDENTIQVNAVVKLRTMQDLEATIHVEENLSVKVENGCDVTLTYQAGMVIDLMGKRVLELYEDVIKDMLEELDNKTWLVHLDKIDKLNTILEKVEIQSISFEPDYINLCFVLK